MTCCPDDRDRTVIAAARAFAAADDAALARGRPLTEATRWAWAERGAALDGLLAAVRQAYSEAGFAS